MQNAAFTFSGGHLTASMMPSGIGSREPQPLPGLRGGEPRRFGTGCARDQDRGYGIGYRGESPLPGMRGAGQGGWRYGTGCGRDQDRGYGVGYRGESPLPGMRGGGQGRAFAHGGQVHVGIYRSTNRAMLCLGDREVPVELVKLGRGRQTGRLKALVKVPGKNKARWLPAKVMM